MLGDKAFSLMELGRDPAGESYQRNTCCFSILGGSLLSWGCNSGGGERRGKPRSRTGGQVPPRLF